MLRVFLAVAVAASAVSESSSGRSLTKAGDVVTEENGLGLGLATGGDDDGSDGGGSIDSTEKGISAVSAVFAIGVNFITMYQKKYAAVHTARARLIAKGYANEADEVNKKARAALDTIASQYDSVSGDMQRRIADLVRDTGMALVAHLPFTAPVPDTLSKPDPSILGTVKKVLSAAENKVLEGTGIDPTQDPVLLPLREALTSYEKSAKSAADQMEVRRVFGNLLRDDFDRVHAANILGDTNSAFAKGACVRAASRPARVCARDSSLSSPRLLACMLQPPYASACSFPHLRACPIPHFSACPIRAALPCLALAEVAQPRVLNPNSMATFLKVALEVAPSMQSGGLNTADESLNFVLTVSDALPRGAALRGHSRIAASKSSSLAAPLRAPNLLPPPLL